jgi:hypothetical protein
VKIYLESGEHQKLVVPANNPSSASISVSDDMGNLMIEIVFVDGFVDKVIEHRIRRNGDDYTGRQ